jgi:hypothetical protein
MIAIPPPDGDNDAAPAGYSIGVMVVREAECYDP